jgi:hypothetical protein
MMNEFGFQRLLKKLGAKHSLFLSLFASVEGRPIRLSDFPQLAKVFMEVIDLYGQVYLDEGFPACYANILRNTILEHVTGARWQKTTFPMTWQIDGERLPAYVCQIAMPSGHLHWELVFQKGDGFFCFYDPYGCHIKGQQVHVIVPVRLEVQIRPACHGKMSGSVKNADYHGKRNRSMHNKIGPRGIKDPIINIARPDSRPKSDSVVSDDGALLSGESVNLREDHSFPCFEGDFPRDIRPRRR